MISAIAAEGQTEKLRVAISSISTSQVNVWVPLDAGFFKKHSLDVELVYISGAPVGTAALMSGEVAISQGDVVAPPVGSERQMQRRVARSLRSGAVDDEAEPHERGENYTLPPRLNAGSLCGHPLRFQGNGR